MVNGELAGDGRAVAEIGIQVGPLLFGGRGAAEEGGPALAVRVGEALPGEPFAVPRAGAEREVEGVGEGSGGGAGLCGAGQEAGEGDGGVPGLADVLFGDGFGGLTLGGPVVV